MRIGIFTFQVPGVDSWDPDSIHSGITGSEEAVIYMSQELASLSCEVVVFGDPPLNSIHSIPSANPRFVSQDFALSEPLDVAVAWRSLQIARILKERGIAKKVYLWPHDTLHEQIPSEGLDGVLWLSSWQRKQWISFSPEFERFQEVFGNGIDPSQFNPIRPRENPYSCIYGSNYGRGLEVLLKIWPEVKQNCPRATLDIYYGWNHWGLLSPHTEEWMRSSITQLADVKEHGLVGHEELNRAYARTSLWTYPCIKPETFCITALRAQLSGAIPVVLLGTALEETVRNGFLCRKERDYVPLLLSALEQAGNVSQQQREEIGQFILHEYTWKMLAARWKSYFQVDL